MSISATARAWARDAFNPDQPRDENGRWGEGGVSGSSSSEASGGSGGGASGLKSASNIRGLRSTQIELPAIKEMPTHQMAPHSQLPVGNAKPTRMGSDPNAKTQELQAMPETPKSFSRQDRKQAAAASAGEWASRALKTREDRQRSSANIRAKGDRAKAERFMEKEVQASSLSKANALSALAASHAARGDYSRAAKTYEQARAHFVNAGKETIAAKMAWSRLEAEKKARK